LRLAKPLQRKGLGEPPAWKSSCFDPAKLGSFEKFGRTATELEQIDKLRNAEQRRSMATPRRTRFAPAARDSEDIVAEIREAARQSDRDIPQSGKLTLHPLR
jgi:hypothetical protein